MERVVTALSALLALAAFGAVSVSFAAPQQARPTQLVAAPSIAAFAQDGSRIAWVVNRQPYPYGKPATCASVWLRDLQTQRTSPLASPARVTCSNWGWDEDPHVMHRMALAGTRALWGSIGDIFGNQEEGWDKAAFSAALGDKERLVGTWGLDIMCDHTEVDDCGGYDVTGFRATGDGQETFYIDEGSYSDISGYRATTSSSATSSSAAPANRPVPRVYRVDNKRALVPLTTNAVWISAGGGRLAVLRKTASGRVVQIQSVPSGAIQTSFKVAANTREVAYDGSALALKGGSQIEIRQPSGARTLVVAVPSSAEGLSLSAERLVYSVGRQVLMLDTRSRKTRTLARAKGTIVGLSIDGHRVAWAELNRGIYSLTVP